MSSGEGMAASLSATSGPTLLPECHTATYNCVLRTWVRLNFCFGVSGLLTPICFARNGDFPRKLREQSRCAVFQTNVVNMGSFVGA